MGCREAIVCEVLMTEPESLRFERQRHSLVISGTQYVN